MIILRNRVLERILTTLMTAMNFNLYLNNKVDIFSILT